MCVDASTLVPLNASELARPQSKGSADTADVFILASTSITALDLMCPPAACQTKQVQKLVLAKNRIVSDLWHTQIMVPFPRQQQRTTHQYKHSGFKDSKPAQ